MIVKTRFAPSPTGYLHIGSVRTALYAWLFAKSNQGKFVLRIEDTDVQRSTDYFVSEIVDNLMWLGLNWDEGPYFQREKLKYYKNIINEMIESGLAYKCYCSADRLLNLRKMQMLSGKKPKYDRKCRNRIGLDIFNTNKYVVRFANPSFGYVSFHDMIRGKISVKNEELDDLIIQRTNGVPTYNFCVVIDDRDMNITHVIRGEDHISNTPRQINIFRALGAKIPIYAHVSMILSDDKSKLSKRNKDITSVSEYRSQGYLPEALLNYIVRLGWSYGNQEIFSISEMIQLFSLESIKKSCSFLNEKKLLWLNRFYIKNLSKEVVKKYLKNQFERNNINIINKLDLCKLIELVGIRCNTLQEIVDCSRYFYEESVIFNEKAASKYLTLSSKFILKIVYKKFLDINSWNLLEIRSVFDTLISDLKTDFKTIAMIIRVAITGNIISPSIFTILYYIGKNISVLRIKFALTYIEQKSDRNICSFY